MKVNKNILVAGVVFGALISNIQAKELTDAQTIFTKKCAMCHTIGKPKNKIEKNKMVAPPIDVAMKGVVVTIDAVDGPFKGDELRDESIEFLKDYLYEPTADKTNCEDSVVEKFRRMPSLKGFISPKELEIVVPWVYDTFRPLKNSKGEYK